MTDSFDNLNLTTKGHDVSNGSIPLHMGDTNAEVMSLFVQNKSGIPHVTNWDDAANSISKTDRSYFVDQQGDQCGDPKDIVIMDDICVVGYPDHTATVKSEINVSGDLHQTYMKLDDVILVCYNETSILKQDDTVYAPTFGCILDYTLLTPEIDDIPGGIQDDHTYFYDAYLKLTISGETTYYAFQDFITSSDYIDKVPRPTDKLCSGQSNSDTPDSGWYYITDLNKIAVAGQFFSPTIPYDLSVYSQEMGSVSYQAQYRLNQNSDDCINCGPEAICEDCVSSFLVYSYSEAVQASLVKLTSFNECGKIDVYHKKSGKIEAFNNNEITCTGHNLSTNDILKISGEFGDGNILSDINGIVYVRVVDENTFTIWSNPLLDAAVYVEDYTVDPTPLTDLTSLKWTCVGNTEKEEFQSWIYYGSFGSAAGMNGYLVDLPSSNYGGNYGSLTLSSVELWDVAVPATYTSQNNPLMFKSSADYLGGCNFGYSLDMMKITTDTEEFYVLGVGEPGTGYSWSRLGQDAKREEVVPNVSPSGKVNYFRLDKDVNSQLTYAPRASNLPVGIGGYIRASNQPWSTVENLIDTEGIYLLTNPSTIMDAIDLADNAVDQERWIELVEGVTIPQTGTTSRSFLWSDRFGKAVGMGHQNTFSGSEYYDTVISSTYRTEVFNIEVTTSGDYYFLASTYSLNQIFNWTTRDGIEYNYEKLCLGTTDGIKCYTYADPASLNSDLFSLATTISIPSDADGTFGQYISQFGDYILTNARSSVNGFGNVSANESDYIYLYKRQVNGKYKLLQKIAPCIYRNDEFYSDLSDSELDTVGLVASDNLSYGGLSEDTYTWTGYELTGKYDIYKNKIILRDPFEYVVFKDNWNTEIKKPLSGAVSPENYFFYRERYNSEGQEIVIGDCLVPPCPTYTQYINYSYDSNFDGSVPVVESYYRHDTLVLFFDIPRFQGYVNVYDSLNVRLSIDRNDIQDDAPMLMFYPMDPRDTISSLTDMPATDGASDYGTSYDLGTYNGGNFVLEDDGTYTVDIDIPPSVFLAGLSEGDLTDSSDQAQDSYNNTGTVHKTLAMGIKVRRRDSNRVLPYIEDGDRLAAGNFYESNAQVQDVSLRLSYSLYEEKSLRRFDLASRKLAIPFIADSNATEDLVATVAETQFGSQIRMGNSLSSAYIDESDTTINKGMHSNSLQIFESFKGQFSSDIYLDTNNELTVSDATASRTYRYKTTTASLDVQSPEFLSLYLRSNLTETGVMPLYSRGHLTDSGNFDLYIKGIAHDELGMPLYIGPLTSNDSLDLSIPNTYDTLNEGMPLVGPKLKGFDAPPTGIPAFIKGPDSSGGIDLYAKAPTPDTGNINLVSVGPLQDTGVMPLVNDAHRSFNTNIGRPPLYMAGMIPNNSGIPMHIGRDSDTGNIPLSIKGPLPDSGDMPLYMLSPYNENLNLSMPLTKGGYNDNMSLVMFDYRDVNNLNLSVTGPLDKNNSAELFTKYDPVSVNNIDDNPHAPCKVEGPNYRFDKSSNSENNIENYNSLTNVEENNGLAFNELENASGLKKLGESIRGELSDSNIADIFYSEDRINTVYDSNGSIFVVGENASVFNAPQNVNGLIVYDVSNGSISNKRVLNLIGSIDSDIYRPTSRVTYKDIAVSDEGRIAFSIYVKYTSNATLSTRGREYLVILDTDFSVNTVISSELVSSSVRDFMSSDKRIADSIVWDGEDLYHSEQTSIFGKIVKRSSSDYSSSTTVVDFEDTPDFTTYEDNLVHNSNLKAGFGHRIVLTDNKLVVAAPLIDPYLTQNTISSYEPYSPRGAVYLFNRSGDTFTYDNALYASGLTGTDITSSSFSNTTTSFDTLFFGYSIDYSKVSQKVIVGEPGYGSGSGNGGYGRVYTFNIGNGPSLIRTSSPSTVESDSLFGLFVALCDEYTELVLSREANGKVYNINTSEEYSFDSSLTDDEVLQYVPNLQTLISSSEKIHVMKLLSLGSDKMIVGRKFDYSYGFTNETLFKLTALNSGKPANFSLFLKTVEGVTNNAPLSVFANQPGYLSLTLPLLGDNNNLNMSLKAPEPDSGSMRLHMANTEIASTTAYIKGLREDTTGTQDLFMKVVTPYSNSLPLSYVHPYDPQYKLNLSINAADPSKQWNSSSLFIDEGTITRTPTDLSQSVNIHMLGDNGVSSVQKGFGINISGGTTGYVNAKPTLYLKGQPSVSVDEYTTLFIKVDDPSGSDNENINLFVKNNQTTGSIINYNNNVPMYIINSVPVNQGTTLFLKRLGPGGGEELSGNANLFTQGPDSSGNLNLYSTAAYSGDTNINLVIPNTVGAPTGYMNFMVRGYEE